MSAPIGVLETTMNQIRTLATVCSTVALLVGMDALPALADPPPWAPAHGYRDKHHGRDDDDAPRVIVTQPPPVAPAPAPVYVAPPPPAVVYQPAPPPPAPTLDIVVPLHFH
jgi:hypothetical protein